MSTTPVEVEGAYYVGAVSADGDYASGDPVAWLAEEDVF